MKKIYFTMLAVLTLGMTSCDMDLKPYDSIPDTEALHSYTDFKNMRVGLYSPLRGLNSGTYLLTTEMMTDNFNAMVGFSNSYGDMYRWQFTPETSDFESIWGSYQILIGRCNYIIQYGNAVDMNDSEKFSESQVIEMKQVIGEAYFMRAYSLFNLAQYFCADYETSTAGNPDSGIAFSTVYAPTSDNGTYPARATLADTYAQIKKDIEAAKPLIPTTPTSLNKANPQAYVSQDVILAFEARVALAMDDYATAANKAVALISSGSYELCADADEILEMWQNDNTPESIWQLPIPSADELASQTGQYFLPYNDGSTPDYIPSGDFLSIWSTNDLRIKGYFKAAKLTTTNGTSGTVLMLNKYPDDSGIHQNVVKVEAGRWQSEPKVFRIAEMYLIAAEAYAQLNDVTNGAKYLNALQSKRFSNFTDETYANSTELLNEVKDERRREMVMEGTRLFDLKRWHMGVTRSLTQQDDLCLFPGSTVTTKLTKAANDPKMILPIPKAEIDANPKCKQNPGY